jgi:hypothetical protein
MIRFPFLRRRTVEPAAPEPVGECQGADFSRVAATLAEGIEEHIRRDGLAPLKAALFRARGGHAPGDICPSEPHPEPVHDQSCDLLYDGDECTCGAAADHHAEDSRRTL